jgi:hypothetical protein
MSFVPATGEQQAEQWVDTQHQHQSHMLPADGLEYVTQGARGGCLAYELRGTAC